MHSKACRCQICSFNCLQFKVRPSLRRMMNLSQVGQPVPNNEDSSIANRLPYNSRQRKPSIDNDSESSGATADLDGPRQDEFRFTAAQHPHEVMKGLDELRKESNFCDVTIAVDGVKFPAHRCVLSSFSPYFKAMFTSRLAESRQAVVAVNGIEPGMMSLILDYAYTSCVVITRTNVQSLLAAANLLQVLPVKEAASCYLYCHMDSSNCIGIHCFAETHACIDLEQKAKKYALLNFSEVGLGEEILSLPAAKLIEFIDNDDLEVEKEELVFQVVMRWLNHNADERKDNFHKVLEHVRLPLMSPYFLHDCVESLPVVRESVECRAVVEEAKLYHMLPDRRTQLQTPRTRNRTSSGTIQVVVAVGGEDDKVVLRSVECYEPVTRKWRTLSCLPFAVSKHGLVASGDSHLYLAGGEFPDGSASRSVYRYNPVLDYWQEMESMLSPRSELGLAMLDGCVYAVGGWEGSFRLDSVERYDPQTNEWQLIAPMKMAVTSPAVVAHDGMLYVTGGAVLEDGDGIELVQRFDPKTDSWTELAPMLIPRSGSAACVLDGYIYVVGGWHASTENTNKVERYDVRNNVWEFQESMCERRYRPGVAVIDRQIFVLGGEEGWDRYHDTIECYSAVTNSWEVIGDLPTSRSWLSCVTLHVKKSTLKD